MQTGELPVTPGAFDQQQQRLRSRLTPTKSPVRVRANLGGEPGAVARVLPPLGAGHPEPVGSADFLPPQSQKKGLRGCALPQGAGAPLTPRKPQLNPYPTSLLLAGQEKPGGSYCAWCVIKNTGNRTIKPARFLALIPDQRGFGKEHPRFECLSRPGPVSF